jgi:hypothetical protein
MRREQILNTAVTDANNCKPVKGTFTVVQPDPLALAASTKCFLF